MKKTFAKKALVSGLLVLMAFFAFAQRDKVIRIFSGGEVIEEYVASQIDYIEVNDLIEAPGNIQTAVTDRQITISWEAVDGAVYNVYRSGDNLNFELLADGLTETSYTDTAPLPGTNYYRVSAEVDGNEGHYTETAAVLPDVPAAHSGVYLGITGFSKGLNEFPVQRLTEDNKTAYHDFINSLTTTEQFTWLYYAVDESIDRLQGLSFPQDLEQVAIITFTDGLDIGSLDQRNDEGDFRFLTKAEYRDALHVRLTTEKVSGKDISAFTVGILQGRGASLDNFRNNMKSLATCDENVKEVSDISGLNQVFKDIAQSLSEVKYVQRFVLSISLDSHNEKCRFTFDDVTAPLDSRLYIEGTYDRINKSLTNVQYVGMTSTSGTEVPGVRNSEGKYSFTFDGLQTPDGTLIPSDHVMHWITDEGVWQDYDDEFSKDQGKNHSIQKIKRSAAIMLNLDCSSSMSGEKFTKLQEAANSFVQTLADNIIDPDEVSSVAVEPDHVELITRQGVQLHANVLPETAKEKDVTWSSTTPSVATVDENGYVTAVSPGTAIITATTVDGGFTATCSVTVIKPVESMEANPSQITLFAGETAPLEIKVLPLDATRRGYTLSNSDADVASFEDGTVKGLTQGMCTLTFTSEEKDELSATCEVTVLQHVESVSLDITQRTLEPDDAFTLTATVLPENAYDARLTWTSSDEGVVKVNAGGFVESVGSGRATVTVTTVDGGFTATCDILVVTPVEGIEADPSDITLYVGETAPLKVNILPQTATRQAYSSAAGNPEVAEYDIDNGYVKGLKAGSCVFTFQTLENPDLKATCDVTVLQHVESVSLNMTQLNMVSGTNYRLTATLLPADASDRNITWTSSNETVATISATGDLNALTPGTAVITATGEGGKSASCEVTVMQAVTSISLNESSLSIAPGESYSLSATVYPENAAVKDLRWGSTDESVVTVNSDGVITGVASGEAKVSAVAMDGSGVSAVCNVTVHLPLEGMSLASTTLELEKTTTRDVGVMFNPANASNKGFSATSSNTSVATVAVSGTALKVTGTGYGTATISVVSDEGGFTATLDVTVTPYRTVQNLALAVRKNGVRYYIPREDYTGSVPAGYSKDGLAISYAGSSFILHMTNASPSLQSFKDAQTFGKLPSMIEAKGITEQWSDVNSALSAFGGSTLIATYWTSTMRGTAGTQGWHYSSAGVDFANGTTTKRYVRCISSL